MEIGERCGFSGMLGSIDCMHWHWKKCPYAWKGMYTHGDHGVPTIIVEAVASHDHWIWHAFFGVAGSNNDINVLNQLDLFVKQLREAPKVQYSINGRQYDIGYYLADAIYPEWPVFVKSIRRQERMLNVPLAFCSLAGIFCADQHVYTSKGILRI